MTVESSKRDVTPPNATLTRIPPFVPRFSVVTVVAVITFALICVRAVAPRPTPIGAVLAGIGRRGHSIDEAAGSTQPFDQRAGSVAVGLLGGIGIDVAHARRDLELVDRTPERFARDRLVGAAAGLILPNLAGPIIVAATLSIAGTIITETALSFLGLGVKPPDVSLGLLIQESMGAFKTLSPYIVRKNATIRF